jgi:peptide/nickel transport system substrate-binding protein
MVGLTSVSDRKLDQENVSLVSAPLTSSVMVFLNNSNKILSDKIVRRALVQATNVEVIRNELGFNAVPSNSPMLRSQFAYNPDIVQLKYDVDAAKKALDEAGWVMGEDGIRAKDGVQMSFRLVSQSLSEYASISQKIQQQWQEIGVKVDALLQPEEDIQSGAISRHDYDVLLYGISIGYDPDVFAYWHSSQANPNAPTRLNLSEYKSDIADEALEAGRTRTDEELRKVKYEPFLKAWRDDAPAIALYQPRFFMVVRGTFEGFESGQLSSATDRYWSMSDWKIRNAQVVK